MYYAESISCDRVNPEYQAQCDAAYQAGYASGLAGDPRPKPFLNGKRLFGLAANMLLVGYNDGIQAQEQVQAQAELEADIMAMADEIAPEPPQSVRYSAQKRWEGYGYHHLVWDNFSRKPACIGVYYQSLDKQSWLINPSDRRDRRVFQSESQARDALISLWEKGQAMEQRLRDYVLSQFA